MQKLGDETDSDDFSDNISSMDDSNDENYVPGTPQQKKNPRLRSHCLLQESKRKARVKLKKEKWKGQHLQKIQLHRSQEKKIQKVADTLQENVDNNEDREIEQEIKTRFRVKRDWEGIPNYFQSNTKFEMFFPVDMEEQEKIKWVDAVFKRKQGIE